VTAPPVSFLATRRGKLTLLLLCAVQFLDVVDSSIMNVALPSIRRDLGFSVQGLQWVLSGYLVTYGGLLLLGGRAGDLFGRQRLLMAERRCSPSARWRAAWRSTRACWSAPGWRKARALR
jgi:Major Facilitator Superfamily